MMTTRGREPEELWMRSGGTEVPYLVRTIGILLPFWCMNITSAYFLVLGGLPTLRVEGRGGQLLAANQKAVFA